MIKYLIFEDEPSALRRLHRMISEIRPSWQLIDSADNIQDGIRLSQSLSFDLIISDIQLSDGNCFQIFSKAKVTKPVIFITAFDEYAIKAFDFNSIHYLLKPIKKEALQLALEKFDNSTLRKLPENLDIDKFSEENTLRKISSKVGNKTTLIGLEEITYIYFRNRTTKAVVECGKEYYLDYTLDKLITDLPAKLFFRINRQQIVNRKFVQRFISHSSNRLLLKLDNPSHPDLIVSKERSPNFKKWILA